MRRSCAKQELKQGGNPHLQDHSFFKDLRYIVHHSRFFHAAHPRIIFLRVVPPTYARSFAGMRTTSSIDLDRLKK
eukprot:9141698-Pyramimonas_sp.AAC.1